MRLAALVLTIALPLPSMACAQKNGAHTVEVVDDLDLFATERDRCEASLPFDRLEMKIANIGYSFGPSYTWTLDRAGRLVFADDSAVEVELDLEPRPLALEVSCFTQAEIQALAEAMIEPAPLEQDCAILAHHAIRGEVTLVREGKPAKREFSLGCTDIANPGLNAAIKAMNQKVEALVASARPSSSTEGN